ncbi:MAG: response regulator [Pseudobutyrivibrio sp.]|nr:response regulator [Pseudobutyrivibrio sp.]
MKITKEQIKYIVLGTLLNCLGRALGNLTMFPGFLNLTGTIYSAYYGGTLIGVITAVLSSMLCTIGIHNDFFYIIANVIVAIVTAQCSKKNKFIKRFISICSYTLIFMVVEAVAVTLVNLSINGGYTPFVVVNSVIDYIIFKHAPAPFAFFVGSIYICFADNFMGLLTLFVFRRVYKFVKKRKRARELKRAIGGKALLGIVGFSMLVALIPMNNADAANELNYVKRYYDSSNGLTSGCANDIAQTQDGSMWIATYGGLYRYNGSKFELIDTLESARSIQSLYVDKDDRLWIGTNGAGITVVDMNQNSYTVNEDSGLPGNTINAISQDKAGHIYLGTSGGLVEAGFEDGKIVIYKKDESLGNIEDISSAETGEVAVVDNVGNVSIYYDGEKKNSLEAGDYSYTSVDFFGDDLYIGTDSEQIQVYHLNNYKLSKIDSIAANGLKHINDIYNGGNGYIFIASDTGIGYLDNSKNANRITVESFTNSVERIYKDYQGNIWFASSRCGLLSLSKSAFSDLFGMCNIQSSVSNVATKWNGNLYVGTDDGLQIIDLSEGIALNNSVTEHFAGKRIRSIHSDGNRLLIAAYGEGLMQVDASNNISSYLGKSGEAYIDYKIRFISELENGVIVTSGEKGLLFMKNNRVINAMEPGKDLKHTSILNMVELSDGTILAGTDGDGIAVIKDYQVQKYITNSDGLASSVILRIVKDKNGDGEFVLTGSGLCYLDAEYNIKNIEGLPYYNNYDLYQSDDNKVFIIGGAGVFVVDYDTLMSESGMTVYDTLDTNSGLPGSLTSNAWNYVDQNNMYICGSTGVYVLNLDKYDMGVKEYKSKITYIKLDGKSQAISSLDPIVIPRGSQKVEFTVELNNFTTSDPYVRYYLSGVDKTKTTVLASEMENIVYYSLANGSYEFHIEVLDDSGKVISERVYTIIKNREVYETTGFKLYFYTIMTLILLFIVLSIINGSVYSITRRQQSAHQRMITKLEKEKRDALERALKSEEEANRTKTAFLANMSHEIRTPINTIIGMDTMIMRETNQDNIKNYADDIRSASKILLSLINDILDFSKIESGKLDLVLGEYDLSVLINDLVNMIQPKATDKKLELEVNINPDIPRFLYGDEVRIEQIIINILNNAVKYTPSGKVTFNMTFDTLSNGDIELIVSISDTGIGIKAEDMDDLFNPYKRIDLHRNKKVEGTGLGLSITKTLLEKMGSTLEVTSKYGEGSTFAFALTQPVRAFEKLGDYKEKARIKETNVTDKERYHAPEAHILVVDDVEMNLIVATSLLKRIQIQIDTASSGKEAIEKTTKNKYDIILLDSMMPEMSGEETLVEIRKNCPLNTDTPVIVLTANAIKGAREEYLRQGYSNYLSKPIDGIKLEAMIQSYLPDEMIQLVDDLADGEQNDKGSIDGVKPEGDNKSLFFNLISKIKNIDMHRGIETAGGKDVYEVICRNFYDTAISRINMIKDAFDSKDIKNYTIQVHALKSTARLIGAYSLSEKAAELEQAGRDENLELITKNTDAVISEYQELYDKFHTMYVEDVTVVEDAKDDRPLLDDGTFEDAFEALNELINQMDYDGVEMVLNGLEDFKMSSDKQSFIDKMKMSHKTFNWDEMEDLIKEFKKDCAN